MSDDGTDSDRRAAGDESAEGRWATVPNVLCGIRLVGSLGLIPLALAEQPGALLVLFVALSATDWLDGKLAIWLDQNSPLGARLDSTADAAMYAAILFSAGWLKGDVLLDHAVWLGAALVAYVASCVAALVKYGRLPSYHHWSAKITWALTVLAAVALFLEWSLWPLRIAVSAAIVANVEGILSTVVLDRWRANVPSFFHAVKIRKERGAGSA